MVLRVDFFLSVLYVQKYVDMATGCVDCYCAINRLGEKCMEEEEDKKKIILDTIEKNLGMLSEEEIQAKKSNSEKRFFELANFIESKMVLLYMYNGKGFDITSILEHCFNKKKTVVIPLFNPKKSTLKLLKIEDFHTDLIKSENGFLMPDLQKCKSVPLRLIDIAIIPGLAFDEKGGRIGIGQGYEKIIPKLPITTRKISIILEEHITEPIPVDIRNLMVDIIITDKRVIYKI
ncbi:MAG: 5-formyltetrahydrofolate cyclo-ligase [Desulfobacteraceae bacterium 4572_19]|nr:MAG: 5-formyltetrahydrofolate cyclo-ligase [Desulfobacteraceae bacterium 4572_19]